METPMCMETLVLDRESVVRKIEEQNAPLTRGASEVKKKGLTRIPSQKGKPTPSTTNSQLTAVVLIVGTTQYVFSGEGLEELASALQEGIDGCGSTVADVPEKEEKSTSLANSNLNMNSMRESPSTGTLLSAQSTGLAPPILVYSAEDMIRIESTQQQQQQQQPPPSSP
eukprot:PhF_6_TR26992/c6_g1_i2/m.39398